MCVLRRDPFFRANSQMVIWICAFTDYYFIGEIDCVSCSNPFVIVHECKFKVDGVTKYIDNQDFNFDNTFSQYESNEELYFYSIKPILDLGKF